MALSQGSWSPTSGMRENWLVQVYETDESGFKAYSFFDQTVNSVAYSGIILNNPNIRESIDIFNSRSSISNVSIEIDNSTSESEALLFGSNDYLNGDVKIYSNLASGTIANFNDIPQIYHGRLESIEHTESSVVLNIVARRAWDNISLPNGYTSNKTIVPLVYGDYSGNSGTDFTDNYTNSNYHPAPFDGSNLVNSDLGFVTGPRASTGSAHPAFYHTGFDKFIPYRNGSANTTSSGDGHISTIQSNKRKSYYLGSTSLSTTSVDSDITVSNLANIHDENLSNSGRFTFNKTLTSTIEDNQAIYVFNFPKAASGGILKLKYGINVTQADTNTFVQVDLASAGGNISSGQKTSTVATTTASVGLASEITQATLTINFHITSAVTARTLNANVDIFEAYIDYDIFDEDEKTDEVYVYTDGLEKSFSSGTCTKLQEFHRDIFYRYLGLTATPDGYSDLDSAKGGTGRMWELKHKTAKSILDKLAYEGGFCYTQTADGTLKYIFVKNAYSSANHTLDKNDLAGVSFTHTPASDLFTDVTVNYNPHPARNEYRSQQTATDATTRSKYNLASNEGKYTINLDILNSSIGDDITGAENDPNDGFIEYYGNLRNRPRVILNAEVVNPTLFDMELGDICTFSNMIPTKAFNMSFSSKYFMVTSLTRSSGKLQAEFTDVTTASV